MKIAELLVEYNVDNLVSTYAQQYIQKQQTEWTTIYTIGTQSSWSVNETRTFQF